MCESASVGSMEAPPSVGWVLSIHPNPVRAVAEFKVSSVSGVEPQALEIYVALGRLVDVLDLSAGKAKWVLPVDAPRGIYFARVMGDQKGQGS